MNDILTLKTYFSTITNMVISMEHIEDYLVTDTKRSIYDINIDYNTANDETIIENIELSLEAMAINLLYFEYNDLAWSETNYQYNLDAISKGLEYLIEDLKEVANEYK